MIVEVDWPPDRGIDRLFLLDGIKDLDVCIWSFKLDLVISLVINNFAATAVPLIWDGIEWLIHILAFS